MMSHKQAAAASPAAIEVRNFGEPVLIKKLQLHGVAAEAARKGDTARIWTRLALVSDAPLFHQIARNLANAIQASARESGAHVRLDYAHSVLLVLKPDESAQLWVDTAAIAAQCMIRHSVEAGTPIFDHDIADVTALSFPCVTIEKTDGVIFMFREGWRFALHFDFNPSRNLDLPAFQSTLGRLYRNLRYRELYDALENTVVRDELIAAGWFPFIELIPHDFSDLFRACEASFTLQEVETQLLAKFDSARLDHVLKRWMEKPHLASRRTIFEPAFAAFNSQQPVVVIKIIATEIEGVLNDAHRKQHGSGAKLHQLLKFARLSAEGKAGANNTLLFPADFAKYLEDYTFANFDPSKEEGSAGSRHAVGHGAARSESYTMTRALQQILTLDQLAFYT